MAELCKKCFIETWLELGEFKAYENGNLKIIMIEDTDFCEGCCEVTSVVLRVEGDYYE